MPKKDRLAGLPLRAPAGKDNDPAYWKGELARAIDMLRSYKRRQDDIVLGLGIIQKRPDLADVIVQGILETTLAVATKRVKDREEALKIAKGQIILQVEASPEYSKQTAVIALQRMEELCPELFETPAVEPEDEAPAAGQEKAG